MKVFIVLCFLVVAVTAFSEETLKKVEGHVKYCSEKVGIPLEEAGDIVFSVIAKDSEPYQCFPKCFFERSGFMNDQGVPQKDVMLDKLGDGKTDEQKAKLSALIDKCTALTGDNDCNRSYLIHNCYWSNLKGKHV